MKKIGLAVVMTLALAGTLVAQDTLEMFYPKSSYCVNGWPDSSVHYSRNIILLDGGGDISAIGFFTEDSLTIYGLATALFTHRSDLILCEDQDPTHAVEDLMLFVYDSVEWLRPVAEPLPVCMATMRPAYYWKIQDGGGLAAPNEYTDDPFPVYERYFSEPYTVKDSFYVGTTTRFMFPENKPNEQGHRRYAYATIPYYYLNLHTGMTPAPYMQYNHRRSTNRWEAWWTSYRFFLPIITIDSTMYPEGVVDTTRGGGEHNAVDERASANRFVVVAPNPTKGEVKVTSSVGMTRVEVYSTDGVKVVEMSTATGEMQVKMDVGHLSAGNYVVRVYTPVGLAIKRLIVQ